MPVAANALCSLTTYSSLFPSGGSPPIGSRMVHFPARASLAIMELF